ncbi:MAG: ExeA family protein [Candidatus Rokuibacteriota bacterium]
MYLDFYGFAERPFKLTPDPKFLYQTAAHREVLAQLLYGVQQSKGFIVLTGEIGTGKTTLLHAMIKRLDESAAVAFLFNSTLSFDGLLEYMLEDFGINKPASTQAQRLVALNTFLIERRRVGQSAVIILDEAQNLDAKTLEQIRLLSNFETSSEKLVQILLVGQPELRAKLNLPQLRQLKQRVALSCSIRPLSATEVQQYILTRLRIAKARDLGLFTDGAVARIAAYSGGIPRVVNIVCDHCLVIGYADQERRISRKIVDQAIETLEEGSLPRRRVRAMAGAVGRSRMTALHWLLATSIGVVLGAAVSLSLRSEVASFQALARSARGLLW